VWTTSQFGHFTPGEGGGASSTCYIEGWVGPRAGLDVLQKRKICCSCRDSNQGRPTRSLIIVVRFSAYTTADISRNFISTNIQNMYSKHCNAQHNV
jgi:hypothetical protein